MYINFVDFSSAYCGTNQQDNILFILFSVLAELNLTCRTRASLIVQGRPLGPSGLGPHFELAPKGLGYRMGRTTSLGLASGPVSPFF